MQEKDKDTLGIFLVPNRFLLPERLILSSLDRRATAIFPLLRLDLPMFHLKVIEAILSLIILPASLIPQKLALSGQHLHLPINLALHLGAWPVISPILQADLQRLR